MHVQPDHLVVACQSLEQGRQWCDATLGATPVTGGRHALMGTHNLLLDLSSPSHEQVYLELIAIDPQAPPPGRPRWFDLDQPALQAAIAEGPRLVAWVGRSPQVDMHRWGLINVGVQPGPILAASRRRPDGSELHWQIVVREDGARLAGGALPVLIGWSGEHPCSSLPASGVALQRLAVQALPPRAVQVMRLRGVTQVEEGPVIRAVLQTPRGEQVLESV
jgi:hypothetical protein